MDREEYYLIDIFKYIFCLGIVFLHSGLWSELGEIGYFIEKCVVRLGVPFFFMTSGFMLENKISKTNKTRQEIKSIFINWTKRLLKPLIIFEIIYIVINSVYNGLRGIGLIKIIAINIRGIIFYPPGALWYLQASILGGWIIYFFIKFKKEKLILFSGGLLYIWALLCNNYYFLLQDIFIGRFIDIFLKITVSARNGLFVGFFFLALGMYIFKIKEILSKKCNTKKTVIILVMIYLLYILEVCFLHDKAIKDDGALFITLPALIFFLLFFASGFKTKNNKNLIIRNLSTGIYLTHYFYICICNILNIVFNVPENNIFVGFITIIFAHTVCLYFYSRGGYISKLLK